jgi:hypothetical protein
MRAFDDTIDVLVHDLSLVQHLSTEYVKRIREDADKQQKSDRNNSAIRHATGVQLTEQLKADLTKARREYWAGEAVHRKVFYAYTVFRYPLLVGTPKMIFRVE